MAINSSRLVTIRNHPLAGDFLPLSTVHGVAALEGLTSIAACRDLGQLQELQLTPGSDPQELLKALIARTAVTHFEVAKPSLHDIFVRIAKPKEDPAYAAA